MSGHGDSGDSRKEGATDRPLPSIAGIVEVGQVAIDTDLIVERIDQVFAFDTDPRNWPRTMASLQDLEVIEETSDGARMNATYRILGRSLDGEMMLTIVEPNEHIVVTFGSPGMTGEVHNRYEETGPGTRIVH